MTEVEKLRECTSCKRKVPSLLKIDGGMRQRLRESTGNISVPPEVCTECYNDLAGLISKGAQLKAQHHAKGQQRMQLWRNRVELLKQARLHMSRKSYSEAAVLYEKYLRVLEIIYDVKPGTLDPELFNNRARAREISVIAMVYWDLVRIYDASPRYGDRQAKAVAKLAAFVKLTPVGKKIIQQADEFIRSAKNPALLKLFIKQAGAKRRGCFIATAVFDSESAPEVAYLQSFRDQVLEQYFFGRLFISTYYFFSPPVAEWIKKGDKRAKPFRFLLKRVVQFLERRFDLKTSPNL